MSNTITIELSAADREKLDDIIVMLGGIYSRLGGQAEPVAVQTEAAGETITPVAEALTEATTAPQAVKEELTVTHEDIRKKVVALSASGKKDQVKEIISAVATKVSDIPADKLADVHKQLTALEG